MAVIGKAITKSLYSIDKVYTYYSGCSDGGREGMSQVQRWGDVYDGVVAGAPALRQSHQQVVSRQHLPQNKTLLLIYFRIHSNTYTLLSSRLLRIIILRTVHWTLSLTKPLPLVILSMAEPTALSPVPTFAS